MHVTSPTTRSTVTGASEGSGTALAPGTHVHEFEIAKVIGEGGFSLVYLAFDHTLHRTIALKEYFPRVLAGRIGGDTVIAHSAELQTPFEAGMRSFINEARLLAQFDHPALVKVYRFWEGNGTAYLAMPFYEGRTLKQVLADQPGRGDEAWLKRLLGPILDALALLHAQRCYHRDISPDNIMLLASDAPILLDFGAARRTVGDMTQAFTAILKPSYAPLEQYADDPGLAQGPWTDIYALAAVLYRAIVRRPPPPSAARVYKDPLEPLAGRDLPGYSTAFLAAIDHALALRPDGRTRSVDEFARALGIERAAGATGAGITGATTQARDFPVPAPSAATPPGGRSRVVPTPADGADQRPAGRPPVSGTSATDPDASATTLRIPSATSAAPAAAADDATIVAPRAPGAHRRSGQRPRAAYVALAAAGCAIIVALVYLAHAWPFEPRADRAATVPAGRAATTLPAQSIDVPPASVPATTSPAATSPAATSPAATSPAATSPAAAGTAPAPPVAVDPVARPEAAPATTQPTGDSAAGDPTSGSGRTAGNRRLPQAGRVPGTSSTTRTAPPPAVSKAPAASDSVDARQAERCATLRTRAELGETLSPAQRNLIEKECK